MRGKSLLGKLGPSHLPSSLLIYLIPGGPWALGWALKVPESSIIPVLALQKQIQASGLSCWGLLPVLSPED